MERLTVPAERLPNGITRMQVIDSRKVKEHAMEFYWRLKEYEDTGLSPEEVTDLMGSHAMAIGELAKLRKWIPVTERLPDKELWEYMKKYNQDNMEVLVMIKGAKEATTLYYDDDGDFCDDEGNAWLVTHWMPLPEPVKEG